MRKSEALRRKNLLEQVDRIDGRTTLSYSPPWAPRPQYVPVNEVVKAILDHLGLELNHQEEKWLVQPKGEKK